MGWLSPLVSKPIKKAAPQKKRRPGYHRDYYQRNKERLCVYNRKWRLIKKT